jgi:serine/threonine protein kinase/Tfp pilus assembly protein PilF
MEPLASPSATAPSSAGPVSAAAERLAAELNGAWLEGNRLLAEEVLQRHPEQQGDREVAFRLLYEEVCLRQEAGESGAAEEVLRRFPEWRDELARLLECQRLLEGGPGPAWPQAGERLGEFRLLEELGRGARGRVYLAAQPALADRPVVLKLTPSEGEEHLALARLQHTYIVPLYFVADWPARYLQGLCMPYLGRLTLAELLRGLRAVPPWQRQGRHVLEALERARREAPPSAGGRAGRARAGGTGPFERTLSKDTFAQAVCRIGACLAGALQHAHERGLVHLDLKPANVLLADDGTPMLLDFHLARGPIRPGQVPGWVGGTPGYMPPEQEAALAAAARGQAAPAAVDGRADVFALGAILYEALGGPSPRPAGRRAARALRRNNPQVSAGLASLINRCLAPSPAARYPEAGLLAADLGRHLTDQPLRGVTNWGPWERCLKWWRRRRQAPGWFAPALALLGVVLLLTGVVWLSHLQALDNAQALSAARAADEARRSADLRRAQRGAAADDLHRLADHLRFLYGMEHLPSALGQGLEERCRTCWGQRDRLLDSAGADLGADREARLRADLLDLAILWADLRARLAPEMAKEEARLEAVRLLEEAEALFGPSPTLARARGLAPGQAPRTAREHCALGRSLLRAGELVRARAELERARDAGPQEFWAQFYHGACCHRLKHYPEALASFNACVALAPGHAECYYNRGLARAALGEPGLALADYDRALELRPEMAAAALNRGLLHFKAGRYPQARADLRHALDHGADPALAYYNLALVCYAQKDWRGARDSVKRALQHAPGHPQARALGRKLSGAAPLNR